MTAPDTNEILRRGRGGRRRAHMLAAMYAGRKQTDGLRLLAGARGRERHADALSRSRLRVFPASTGSAPYDRGAAGLREAHAKGSLAALRMLAALTAAGRCGGAADWRGAPSMMREAVDAGDAPAKREIAALLLGRDPQDADGAHLLGEAAQRDLRRSACWPPARARKSRLFARSRIRQTGRVDCAPDCAPDPIPEREVICGRPRIGVFRAPPAAIFAII
ncbi:MAG: hypothetical protein R3C42_01485 [Parvularculaceae bacterium]